MAFAIKGMSRVRKILRNMPDNVAAEVKNEMQWVTDEVVEEAKSLAPERTGTLKKYITGKVGRDGFSAKIGFRTKTAKRKAFYAHFIEFGTKGYNTGDTRRAKNSKSTKKIYKTVAAQPARPFLFPAFESRRKQFVERVQRAVNKAIERAANGDFSPPAAQGNETEPEEE